MAAVIGIAADGNFVFDNGLDSLGRRVRTAATSSAAGTIVAGPRWVLLPPPPPLVSRIGVAADGAIVFDNGLDSLGRRVRTAATSSAAGTIVAGPRWVLIPPPGNSFVQSLNDALSLAENSRRVAQLVRGDAAALTEQLSRAVQRGVADAVGIAEQETGRANKQLADSPAISEGLATLAVKLRSFSEAVGAAEGLASSQSMADLLDAFNLTESQRRQVEKNLTEAAALSELLQTNSLKSGADTLAPGESFNTLAVKLKATADTVSMVEATARLVGRAAVDSVAIGEALGVKPSTGGGTTQQGLSDSLAAGENLTTLAGKAEASTALITESITRQVAKQLFETLALTETYQAIVVRLLALAESLAAGELLAAQKITLAQSVRVRLTELVPAYRLTERREAFSFSEFARAA